MYSTPGESESRFRVPSRYSTRDWWTILLGTPKSRVLRRIRHPMMFTAAWSALILGLYRIVPLPQFSFLPHNLIGSALSLLLVFRTNAAYTRFWEGGKRWQMLSDNVRSLSRMVMLYRDQVGRRRTERVVRLMCAFPVVLKQYLRGNVLEDVSGLSHLLTEADCASLRRVKNKPLHVTNLLAQQLRAVPDTTLHGTDLPLFSSRERLAMLKIVSDLSDCVGACERIVQTPIPFHYSRHTSRLATLFVNTLPFVLVRDLGLLLIPTMAILCWALFGIQEIGLMIEEPFRETLQLDHMCASIQRDIVETLECAAPTRYDERYDKQDKQEEAPPFHQEEEAGRRIVHARARVVTMESAVARGVRTSV